MQKKEIYIYIYIHEEGSGNKSIYVTVGKCSYSAFCLCFKDLCP